MTLTLTPSGLRIAALLVLMVALASFALVQVRADGGTITACVNNNSGEIKIVDNPDDCKGNTAPLEWSSGGGGGPVDFCDLELRIKTVFPPFALDPACTPPPLDSPTITEVSGTKVVFPEEGFAFYRMMVHGEAAPSSFVDIYVGTAEAPCGFVIGSAFSDSEGTFWAGDEDGPLELFLDDASTWPLHFGATVFDPFLPGFTECSDAFGPVDEPEVGPGSAP